MKKTLIMSLAVNTVLFGALACISGLYFCAASSLAQTHAASGEICLCCHQCHFGC